MLKDCSLSIANVQMFNINYFTELNYAYISCIFNEDFKISYLSTINM